MVAVARMVVAAVVCAVLVPRAAAEDPETVEVCVSSAGTRFDRLTAKECAAQGWTMQEVPKAEASADGSRLGGGTSRMCRDGQWRPHCPEDGAPAPRAPSAHAEAMKTLEWHAKMRARCEADWPVDFRMQQHCLERQQEGAREVTRWVNDPQVKSTPALQQAVAKCGDDWSDAHGYDWRMLAHCIERQVTAYRALR